MTQVICSDDCGNATRTALLRDFNIAFARNNAEAVESSYPPIQSQGIGDLSHALQH